MTFLERLIDMLKAKNVAWKVKLTSPLLRPKERILDFGCGDFSLATAIKKTIPQLRITGIDVSSLIHIPSNLEYVKYDGVQIPFRNDYFDTTLSFYVFHHCKNAKESFVECLRVSKKRVIFVEAIPRNKVESSLMVVMDWIYNMWKPEPISFTLQFLTIKEWYRIFEEYKLQVAIARHVKGTIFSWLPIGKIYIFEVYKKNTL